MTVIISILLLILAFYLLAIITDDFFVPSIDKISAKLGISSDAAGATLLAAGSSAPEFFTSFIAVFGLAGGGEHGDVGAGTIVGSAIFNVLVIVGVSAAFKTIKLQWQPVIRDQVFYIVTILLLLFAFWDGNITKVESLIFVAAYGIYIFTVVKWRKWLNYEDVDVEISSEEKNLKGVHRLTHRVLSKFVPDPLKHPKLMYLTFVMAIALIAGLSFLLVDQVVSIADVLSINATFLALTVLAAGTSVPDLIGSIVVAKQGRGDMAVSNAIGSNIFDILFGLGFPWLLYLLVNGGTIAVGKDNLMASVLLLFATVVSLLFVLFMRDWKIGHRAGWLLVALYAIYCVYIAISVA